MRSFTSISVSGLALWLIALCLCLQEVAAVSDHGSVLHPRQFRGGRGGGGRPQGGPLAGARGQYNRFTWFGQLKKRFDDVPIVEDQGIATPEFLDAADSLPAFFAMLGNGALVSAEPDRSQQR
jgi:hypothetical protein